MSIPHVGPSAARVLPRQFDPAVPHPARIYAYWLGGKDHFPVDRKVAEEVAACRPQVVAGARANRAFLARAVRYLAGQCRIQQFVDVGPGLPAPGNTHDVAQGIAPESKIVYVDNDRLVLAHARALMTSRPEGVCEVVDADLRDPETIMKEAARTLDLSQPVAVMLVAVVHFLHDADDPAGIVATLASFPVARQLCGHFPPDRRLRARSGGRRGGRLQRDGPGRPHRPQPPRGHRAVRRAPAGPARRGAGQRVAARPRSGARRQRRHVCRAGHHSGAR